MDLLEGVSLRSVLDSTASAPLSFEEAGPVILAVANALEYLHAKGLAYGEIRPEHVFVTFDYRVQLLDVAPVTALPFAPYFVEDATAQGVRTPDVRDNVYTLACLPTSCSRADIRSTRTRHSRPAARGSSPARSQD